MIWMVFADTAVEEAGSILKRMAHWGAENAVKLTIVGGILLATLVVAALVKVGFRRLAERLKERRPEGISHRLFDAVALPLFFFVLVTGLSLSVGNMPISSRKTLKLLNQICLAGFALDILWLLQDLTTACSDWYRSRHAAVPSNLLLADLLRRSVKAVIWIFALLFILQNVFNLNVSAMIAGAGVAGLAIAFAAQNTVSNLFGAVSLILDKPFRVGDWVKINEVEGAIENIGLRSTRIRSAFDELYIVPNRVVADASIKNVTRRRFFRYSFTIGIVYESTPEQVELAKRIILEILEGRPSLFKERPPRCNFTQLDSYSLNFACHVWLALPDLWSYQAEISQINLEIFRRFNEAGLSFAYPTSTTHVNLVKAEK